jgi:hypothetical protein
VKLAGGDGDARSQNTQSQFPGVSLAKGNKRADGSQLVTWVAVPKCRRNTKKFDNTPNGEKLAALHYDAINREHKVAEYDILFPNADEAARVVAATELWRLEDDGGNAFQTASALFRNTYRYISWLHWRKPYFANIGNRHSAISWTSPGYALEEDAAKAFDIKLRQLLADSEGMGLGCIPVILPRQPYMYNFPFIDEEKQDLQPLLELYNAAMSTRSDSAADTRAAKHVVEYESLFGHVRSSHLTTTAACVLICSHTTLHKRHFVFDALRAPVGIISQHHRTHAGGHTRAQSVGPVTP